MASQTDTPRTLAEKVWDRHVVHRADGEPDILYVDLHLVHEVTSPQAFESLRLHGRPVRRPDLTVATMDHNVPTTQGPVTDTISARQMEALATNAKDFDVTLYPMGSPGQGIVHVIGPEQGYTQPGLVDRLRRLAHLDARSVRRARDRHRHQRGRARPRHPDPAAEPSRHDGGHRRRRPARLVQRQGHHPGDHQPHRDGRRCRPHHRVPRLGDPRPLHGGPHDDLQHVDRRRCACRHGGARTTPPSPTSKAVPTPRRAPTGTPRSTDWRTLPTDDGATFDKEVTLDASALPSLRQLGHQPRAVRHDRRRRARPRRRSRTLPSRRPPHAPSPTWTSPPARRCATSVPTRSSSVRARTRAWRTCASPPAWSVAGRSPHGLRALVVPGSYAVKQEAEAEGLDRIFEDAGFEWRGAGCSMCLGMNPDIAEPGRPERQHQQPQLRGPPGQGRAHAPGEPRRGGRHRDRRPLHDPGGPQLMEPDHRHRGHRAARRPQRRRHRPDHPGRIPQAHRTHRVRTVPVRRVAQGSRLRDQRSALRERFDHDRRARTSAAAPAASTRRGRSRTPGSRR